MSDLGARVAAGVAAAYRHLYADALRVLGQWAPADPGQQRLRAAYLTHLRAHPDAVAKAGPPAHLTASVLVFDEPGTHVLLTLHRKVGAWLQFGGHLETGDRSVAAAAEREAVEESGVAAIAVHPVIAQLDRHPLGGGFTHCREHLDVRYAAVVTGRPRPVVSAESHDVRWWAVDQLPPGSAAELPGLVAACRAALA